MRGPSDNENVFPRTSFSGTNSGSGFEPIHFGHLYVHEDQVEAFLGRQLDRNFAIGRDGDFVSMLFEHAHREHLIDGVIFGQEDSKMPHVESRAELAGFVCRTLRL
jgi:hypothetical protein